MVGFTEYDFPEVPTKLVEALEQAFPDKLPDVDVEITFDTVNILRGRADIIRLLRAIHDEQHQPEGI